MLGRDRVPRLGRPKVQVVDAVQVHVLRVPTKRRLPHAEVQVRRVDALYLHPVVFVDAVQDRAEVVDVPVLLVGVGEGPGRVRPIQRVDERYVLPVLPLQLLHVVVERRTVPTAKTCCCGATYGTCGKDMLLYGTCGKDQLVVEDKASLHYHFYKHGDICALKPRANIQLYVAANYFSE